VLLCYIYNILISVDYSILGRATRDVRRYFPYQKDFNARWLLIVTWHNVTFFGAAVRPYPVSCAYVSDETIKRKLKIAYDTSYRRVRL